MKKTLVALAVAATAATAVSTANAATIYEQDGTKIELSGSLRLYLGRFADDQRGDLRDDDSRVIFKASHDLGNGLSGFAGYELRFDGGDEKTKNTFGNPDTRHLYAGFKHQDIGALSFGRQLLNIDDVLDDGAYANSAALYPVSTRDYKVVKFRSVEWNGLSFGLDYIFGDSNKNRSTTGNIFDQDGNHLTDLKNGYSASLFYNYDISDNQSLKLAATYLQRDYDDVRTTSTTAKERFWLAHAAYSYGPFYIAANYGQENNKSDYTGKVKTRYSLVDLSYQVIDPSRVYAQWERYETKTDKLQNQYLVGVDYKLHKNVITYVEYAHKRTKDWDDNGLVEPTTKKDNVYGVGLRVFF